MRARFVLVVAVVAGVLASVSDAPKVVAAAGSLSVDVCPEPAPGYARCFAKLLKGPAYAGNRDPSASAFTPDGMSPAQIKAAYGFRAKNGVGRGQTVAIVTAFDAPTVEAELNIYSDQFGLPRCTTANGCFTKINARGVTPEWDELWALEAALDVQLVHAIAPSARIVLVQASSNNFVDLFQAFHVATQHAKYISNSWGAAEFSNQAVFDPLLTIPGISEFFGTGDTGAPGLFPAFSPDVIAVGGTRLILNTTDTRKKETAWTGSGGGCSTIYNASAVQSAFPQYPNGTCAGKRAIPDLSANADPDTGYAIYLGNPDAVVQGWVVIGGTSASTPVMAAKAASTGLVWDAAFVYSAQRRYFDVTRGNNGFPAGPGYDLATGRGRFGA